MCNITFIKDISRVVISIVSVVNSSTNCETAAGLVVCDEEKRGYSSDT
jgi:hypothetical protein